MSKQTPQIRFKGFTDDWEERKLTDIVSRLSKTSNNSELPKVEFEDIVAGEGRLNKNVSHKFDDRKGILFESQNILYGKLRPYLKNWLLADFKGIALGDFWVFQSINSDPKFVYSLIQSNHYQKVANDTSGTKMPRSDWKKVSSTVFTIPNYEEQQQIGSFFKQLDNTIALHQRKLDLLKEQKKGFLQKMFPKNGAKVPELRFAGFTDDWEERKLGNIVEFFSGLTYSPDNIVSEDGTFVLRSSNVKGGELVNADNVYVDSSVVNSSNIQTGDIVVVVRNGSRGLIGKHAQVKTNMESTVIGAFMTGIRSTESNFINALLDTQQFKIEINKNLGATINQITTGAFKKMLFSVTPNIEEQQKIGSFFKQLDDTIALHQRKLNLLQEQKKGFLQKMFVQ